MKFATKMMLVPAGRVDPELNPQSSLQAGSGRKRKYKFNKGNKSFIVKKAKVKERRVRDIFDE